MAINTSSQAQQFVLGTICTSGRFEPLTLFTELVPHAAAMFQVPQVLQIFSVEPESPWEVSCTLDPVSTTFTRLSPPISLSDIPDVRGQLSALIHTPV